MRLAEIIIEAPMSPGALDKFSKTADVLVGFEFEVYLPDTAIDNYGSDVESDYSDNPRPYSVSGVIDFYSESDYFGQEDKNRLSSSIYGDYYEWIEEKIESNKDEFNDLLIDALASELDVDSDDEQIQKNIKNETDAYYEAENIAKEDFANQSDYDIEEYFKENYPTMRDFETQYDLYWPNVRYAAESDVETVASMLGDFLSTNVLYGEYHANKDNTTEWRVETDASLTSAKDEADGGIEIISPPLPLTDAIAAFKQVVQFIKQHNGYTNNSTGLHINISVNGKAAQDLDYVKLVLFSGDKYMLQEFERYGSTYAHSSYTAMAATTRSARNNNVAAAIAKMKDGLNIEASRIIHSGVTEKFMSINSQGNYVEFRAPGGDWLGGGITKSINATLRFAQALTIATDQNAYKKEYTKKLYKLLQGNKQTDTTGSVALFTDYVANNIDKDTLIFQLKRKQKIRANDKARAIKNKQIIDDILANDPHGLLDDKHHYTVTNIQTGESTEVDAKSEEDARLKIARKFSAHKDDFTATEKEE